VVIAGMAMSSSVKFPSPGVGLAAIAQPPDFVEMGVAAQQADDFRAVIRDDPQESRLHPFGLRAEQLAGIV
jgi:hypothetical protein